MRWVFLLLLVLNLFYYLWHQQQAPVRVTEVPAVSSYRPAEQRLSLVGETNVNPPPKLPQSDGAQVAVASDQLCLFLGGFARLEVAEALAQQLLARDIAATVQAEDITSGMDYWVYLAPLASRQAAIRQLRELQSRRVDSYVITMGELENGISLGIFSTEAPARVLRDRLAAMGYSAQMNVLPRSHRRYFVRVAPEARASLDAGTMAQLGAPGLEVGERPCKGVAERASVE